jgi:hypothetical protein
MVLRLWHALEALGQIEMFHEPLLGVMFARDGTLIEKAPEPFIEPVTMPNVPPDHTYWERGVVGLGTNVAVTVPLFHVCESLSVIVAVTVVDWPNAIELEKRRKLMSFFISIRRAPEVIAETRCWEIHTYVTVAGSHNDGVC